MTEEIKTIIMEHTLFEISDHCRGEGKVGYFCGHETTVTCPTCSGTGLTAKPDSYEELRERLETQLYNIGISYNIVKHFGFYTKFTGNQHMESWVWDIDAVKKLTTVGLLTLIKDITESEEEDND